MAIIEALVFRLLLDALGLDCSVRRQQVRLIIVGCWVEIKNLFIKTCSQAVHDRVILYEIRFDVHDVVLTL